MEKISENTVRDKDHAYIRTEGLLDPHFFNNCYRCVLYPTSTECRELTRILGPCKGYFTDMDWIHHMAYYRDFWPIFD